MKPRSSNPALDLGIGPAWKVLGLALGFLLGVCFWMLTAGCTVTPRVVHNSQASFDGDQQNSGILGFDDYSHCIITLRAVERYNALVDKYGQRFTPPLQRNEGIFLTATNTGVMSFSAVDHFVTMNRWSHQSQPLWDK